MEATPTSANTSARRSRKRWYLIGGFFLLVAATPVAYHFASSWWTTRALEEIYRELDAEDPNWRWHELVAELKAGPDDENSAVQIQKIELLLKAAPFDLGPKWVDLKYHNARLTSEQTEILRKAFAKLDPQVLAEARKLKDMPQGRFAFEPVENPFFEIKFDFVQGSRSVMYLLQNDAILREHDGDHEGAVESCQALVNTARSLKDQPFLIGQLVRFAGQAIAVNAVERTLAQGEVNEPGLQKLQMLLESEGAADGLAIAMRGERAAGHQMYLQIRDGKMAFSELAGGRKGGPSGAERLLDAFPGVFLGGYPEYLRTMNEQVRASKLKDAERAEAMHKIEDRVRAKRTVLGSMIMPATMKTNEASQRTQAWMRCAALAVAVERYRLKKEGWPRTVDDLVQAGLLQAIPKDPYDGQPLRLLRTPTGFVVYSIGNDLVDNGGKFDRTNPRAAGSDLGVELWEPRLRGVAPPAEAEK